MHNLTFVKPQSLFGLVLVCALAAMGCGGAQDDRPPVWGYISPAIIQPNCATSSCHSQAAAVAGLNLSTVDDSWISLLKLHLAPRAGVAKDAPPQPRLMVTPYQPAESRVVQMMRASGANRMPPDRPLAEADIALIEQWIVNGAKND